MVAQLIDTTSMQELRRRMRGEFLEMPGLRLTAAQASRVWDTDLASSRVVLDGLVDVAFLRRNDGVYMRADSDPVPVKNGSKI